MRDQDDGVHALLAQWEWALTVPCPTCGRPKGWLCWDRAAGGVRTPHINRCLEARKAKHEADYHAREAHEAREGEGGGE